MYRNSRRINARLPRAQAPTPKVEGTTATVRLYDIIDSYGEWWGVSAKEVAEMLDELPNTIDTIELRINSSGGDVFDAIAIANLLATHPARIVAIVDGLAASAASFIAVRADETVMSPYAEMMIHDAWGVCAGSAADMTAMAATLESVSGNIAAMYAAKAGGTVEEWRAVMVAEAWYSAEEAVAAGLADRVDSTDDAQPVDRVDTSTFRFSGRASAPAPDLAALSGEPAAEAEEQPAPVFRAPMTALLA